MFKKSAPNGANGHRASALATLASPTGLAAGIALIALSTTVGVYSWQGLFGQGEPNTEIDEVPDRFVELHLSEPTSQPEVNRLDANNEEVASASGLLRPLRPLDCETPRTDTNLSKEHTTGISGLLGAKGVQVGSAGLGSRGNGLGGGGSTDGIGSLATSGRGTGAGYGSAAGYGAGSGKLLSGPLGLRAPVQERTANRETYTDHGVNEFTLVAEDSLSTFSIDVDTASYTMARRKLLAGQRPDPAGVRVEEFINYQKYAYAKPTDGETFAVHMDAMPDPFRNGSHILRVGVQGRDVIPANREPLHLTFLVDVSGSMGSADKLALAQRSLHLLTNTLQEKDTVALATYAGRVARILEPTSAADAERIHAAIDQLRSGGSTAMSSGMDIAYEMADAGFVPGHENRVIVLSDGDANVGRTSWDEMLSRIKGYADKGITLSTIGFGMGNYQDTLMEQLANNGDGNNYYIDSFEQARRVFGTQMTSTMLTIARDVKIQVELDPDSVHAYRLIGYENRDIADEDFRNDRVDAGEVGAGHSVTALYEVKLKDGYDRSLATVHLRHEAPGADKAATERSYPFASRALAERVDLASRETRIAYAAATFAEVLRSSPHAEEIDLGALARFARDAAAPGNSDHAELVELIEKARLRQIAQVSTTGH